VTWVVLKDPIIMTSADILNLKNPAHLRQSRPDSGLDFQVRVLENF
jgi:hypothetical protein